MDKTFTAADFDDLPKSVLTGKPVLHFVHANGIPAPTYTPLFAVWEAFFSIEKIDYLGMDNRYPIDDEWVSLTRQVDDSIRHACDKHGVDRLVAVGHSVGAVTTLQTLDKSAKSSNADQKVARAVLLDPSLLMGLRSLSWFLARKTNHLPFIGYELSDKMSPAAKSKYRKDTFTDKKEAYDKLRTKGLFKAFDETAFQCYIDKGFIETDNGVTLAISRAAEVAIFRTMPMHYWHKTIHPAVPVTLIAGKNSEFTKMGSYTAVAKRFGIPVVYHDGSHMFPLEHPVSVANTVLDFLKKS